MFHPNFDKGLILKQHMLEALRDYPYTFAHTLFTEMGDGILSGLRISICEDDESFLVSPGLVKLDGEICFLTEAQCQNLNDYQNFVYLEKRPPAPAPDGSGSTRELHVVQRDAEQEISAGRMELFRYARNPTARVKEFQEIGEIDRDMNNRIDRSHTLKSVAGGSTLCDEFYTLFARFLLSCPQADARDIGFAYQCLNGIHTLEAVKAYFQTEDTANDEIIRCIMRRVQSLNRQTPSRQKAPSEPKPENHAVIIS